MKAQSMIQRATLLFLLFGMAACASTNSPWARHDRTAGYKAAASDPSALCDVVIENATDIHLDAAFQLEGSEKSVGMLSPGQRAEFGISCTEGRIEALAYSALGQDPGGSSSRFRKVGRLDVRKACHLRFTASDQSR